MGDLKYKMLFRGRGKKVIDVQNKNEFETYAKKVMKLTIPNTPVEKFYDFTVGNMCFKSFNEYSLLSNIPLRDKENNEKSIEYLRNVVENFELIDSIYVPKVLSEYAFIPEEGNEIIIDLIEKVRGERVIDIILSKIFEFSKNRKEYTNENLILIFNKVIEAFADVHSKGFFVGSMEGIIWNEEENKVHFLTIYREEGKQIMRIKDLTKFTELLRNLDSEEINIEVLGKLDEIYNRNK